MPRHSEKVRSSGAERKWPALRSEQTGMTRNRLEAILTSGFPAIAACKGASVPAIASRAGDLVSLGLVASFRRPGGNITGISDLAGELAPKRLAILKEALPSIRRVAMLWNREDRAMGQRYELSAGSATTLGISVQR